MISLSQLTPASLMPGALGHQLPHESPHIRVFNDRINPSLSLTSSCRCWQMWWLIRSPHILQGVSRHSDTGIMKARWDADDFMNINWQSAEFEPKDIDLITRGLAGGAARAIVATNNAVQDGCGAVRRDLLSEIALKEL